MTNKFWRDWAGKINGKAGNMPWIFAMILIICIMIVALGWYTGGIAKIWNIEVGAA